MISLYFLEDLYFPINAFRKLSFKKIINRKNERSDLNIYIDWKHVSLEFPLPFKERSLASIPNSTFHKSVIALKI